MLSFFTDDPKFTISLVIAVASILLAIIFYARSKNIRIPSYSMRTLSLVEGGSSTETPIKITFYGEPVESVSLTYLAFWNHGRATIRSGDVSDVDPLRITPYEDCQILSAEILFANRAAANFRVQPSKNGRDYLIKFDFVDYNNGVIIKVFHSGNRKQRIDLVGTIVGTTGFINVDNYGAQSFGFSERMYQRFVDSIQRIVPDRYWQLYHSVEERRNLFIIVLISIPLMIVTFLIACIYFPIMMVSFFYGLVSWSIGGWRHSMPKDLYSAFRY